MQELINELNIYMAELNQPDYIKHLIEYVYYISGIVLLIGLCFTYKQLKAMRVQNKIILKDTKAKYKRDSIEKSLEYLDKFSKEIIPNIGKYRKRFDKICELELNNLKKHSEDLYFNEKYKSVALIFKKKSEIHIVLNDLECFAAAIQNRLCDEDIVFTPTASVFCRFVSENLDFIEYSKNKGAPYKNVTELYKSWDSRLKLDVLEQQSEDLRKEITKAKRNVNPKEAIGV